MTDYQAQVVVAATVVNIFHFDYPVTLSGGSLVVASSPPETINPGSGQSFFVQAGAGIGWTVASGILIPPVSGGALTSGQLNAYASRKALAILSGGFTVTQSAVAYIFATDPDSIVLLNSVILRLGMASPPTTVSWPCLSGPHTFSAANFTAAVSAIYDWILGVEAELATVLAGIAGLTITTTSAIEGGAWPASHFP